MGINATKPLAGFLPRRSGAVRALPCAASRGFVLFLALGVLALVYLLAIAATGAAFNGRNVVRLQDEREQAASARRTLESLAALSKDLPPEGTIPLGAWTVSWKALELKDSRFAAAHVPEQGEGRALQVTCRREQAVPPRALLQQVLLVRTGASPWVLAAWTQPETPAPPAEQP